MEMRNWMNLDDCEYNYMINLSDGLVWAYLKTI